MKKERKAASTGHAQPDPFLAGEWVLLGFAALLFSGMVLLPLFGWSSLIKAAEVIATVILIYALWSRRKPYARTAKEFAESEIKRVGRTLGQRIETLHELTSREFEFAVGRLFREQGYEVEVTRAVADAGKDLVVRQNGERFLVEVKQYRPSNKVGRPAVMKLHSAVVHERATGGMLITTSSFSAPAIEFARQNNLELIDGPELAAMLIGAYPEPEGDLNPRSMCPRCGQVITFRRQVESETCPKGHNVRNPVPPPPEPPTALGVRQRPSGWGSKASAIALHAQPARRRYGHRLMSDSRSKRRWIRSINLRRRVRFALSGSSPGCRRYAESQADLRIGQRLEADREHTRPAQ